MISAWTKSKKVHLFTKKMKKIGIALLIIFVLGLGMIILNRNIIARFIIVNGIKKTSGLNVEIGRLNIGLPSVEISGLKIHNPPGFNQPVLADIPKIYFDFDLPAFFKNKVYILKFEIEVKELNIILNEKGKLNVNSLALLAPKPGKGKPPEIKINQLKIKIDKVVYKGYLPAIGVKSMEFNPNINETFHNVTDPSKVTSEIMQKVLSRIGIEKFAGFNIQVAAQNSFKEAGAVIQDTLDNTGKNLKKIFSN